MHRQRSRRRTRPIHISAVLIAGVAGAALAQQPPEDERHAIKVEVTGSNIRRPDTDSALPVQILTREDILRSGAATSAELLSKVSANILGFNDQVSIGEFARPGLSSANLRGIGDGSTLVLLNGRRIANYAFSGGAVDLNAIPLTAIDRVEILKDGASAIYGTDAIAGVVNFILRKDFEGFEATGHGAWTEHGGADQRQAIVSAGYGDLSTDRFNVFATISYRKEDALRAVDRPFSRTGYIPAEGINQLSGASFPANIQLPSGRLVNPAVATGCAPPASIPATLPGSPVPVCGYDFPGTIDIIPPVERTGAVARATFQVDADNQLFAEANYAYNRFVLRNSPAAVFQGPGISSVPVAYPATGPYYPTEFAAANGISGDVNLRYRTVPLGLETDATDTKAWRGIAGAEGAVWGWSYGTAITYSENRQTDRLVSGYVSLQRFIPALAGGLINPFGPSGAEGDALLASTQIVGDQHHAKASTLDFDVKASKEIYALPGGPLAIAFGGEARRERLDNVYSQAWTSGDILGVGSNQQSTSGARTVEALFVEASVPVVKGFEAQIAARYDHYGDFGDTTNPKIALRWQPARSLLLRTSWGTGFRAPTLYDLFTPVSYGGSPSADQRDPLRCPITHLPADCPGAFLNSFRTASGGNPSLRPEESEQFNAGIVWEPVTGLSLSSDYWKINKRDVIAALNTAVVFGQFDRYAQTNIIRGPVDPNFPDLPGPIETVVLTNQNLGNLRTSGIDVDVKWRGPVTSIGAFGLGLDATYVLTWAEQLDGIHYMSSLARNGFGIIGPVPRWKHYATLNWDYGHWGATLAQTYQSGYVDANVDRTGRPLAVAPRSVGSYEVWDLQERYSGFQNTTIALGVKNVMDRAPPFSNQTFTRQIGYDPKYADPRGRIFYARLTYTFK
jgi:iron complex outermembrane recepter protein